MSRTTPPFRRLVGVTMAAAVSVAGLAITTAVAPAAHAEPLGTCNASFDVPLVGPGDSATESIATVDDSTYPALLTIDGALVYTSDTEFAEGPITHTYDEWKALAGGVNHSVGYRLYAPGTNLSTATYQGAACGAEVTIGEPVPASDQTIDFPAIEDHPLTDGTVPVDVSSDSGLEVTLTSQSLDVCTVLPGTHAVSLQGKGWCSLVASQDGDESYNAATDAYEGFWVQVPQHITFPPVSNTPQSAGHVALDATADSGRSVDYTSKTPDVCTVSATPPPPAAPLGGTAQGAIYTAEATFVTHGYCDIVANQDGGGAYLAAPVDEAEQKFWVQGEQTLTFPSIPNTLLSAGTVTLDADSDSHDFILYTVADSSVCDVPVLTGATNEDESGQVTASTRPNTTLTLKKVGTCTVTAWQPGDGQEYLPSNEVTRSFQVYENVVPTGHLSLDVPAGVALSKHTAPFTATAAPVENVMREPVTVAKVTTTSATPSVCTVATASSVNLLKAGTCTLTAAQNGYASVTKSFPVWGAPAIPAKGKTTQTITVLGQGESDLRVTTKPAGVCRAATDGSVTLIAPGTCKITVTDGKDKIRTGNVKIAFVKSAKPSQQLKHGGKVLFAFDSAALTPAAKKALNGYLATLRKADTVIVYGNTYGPGKNSAHSRKLADDRAAAVVSYLKAHGVKAKAVTVAAAMQNPVSKDPAKNRRADIYYLD
jgi:outer membrane protein OmpA-like peptidoglycan-associated protein